MAFNSILSISCPLLALSFPIFTAFFFPFFLSPPSLSLPSLPSSLFPLFPPLSLPSLPLSLFPLFPPLSLPLSLFPLFLLSLPPLSLPSLPPLSLPSLPPLSLPSSPQNLNSKDVDPEVLFTKQEKIGKGSFGEVFKGYVNHPNDVMYITSL